MDVEGTSDPRSVVASIDRKATRLSALLRDVDNHPLHIDPELTSFLDDTLEQLECRIAATRALLHQREQAVV